MSLVQASPASGEATGSAETRAGRGRAGAGRIALVLAAAGLGGLATLVNPPPSGGLDPDSAMRLVQVRDLLGGQGWFDLTQHRLGLGGVEMHWSRLIDAPMAAFLAVAGRVVDQDTAEHLLLVVWPAAWLAVTVWACLSLSRHLGGRFAAGIAFVASAVLLLSKDVLFPPSLDHHNVQLALLMLALWGFVARHASRAAPAASGLCVGTSLVVGVELLPMMAALCGMVAGTWAWRGRPERRSAIAFGAALAGGMTGGFLLTAPASAWAGGYCDAISVDLLVPAVGGAVLLAVAAVTLSEARPGLRLGILGLAGGSLLAASLAALPACLSNPLDRLDPLLVTHWLDHVSEARSIGEAARREMGGAIGLVYMAGALSVLACLYQVRVGPRRAEWSMLLVVVAIVAAFAAYQVRYVLFLMFLCIPVWAALTSHLRRRSHDGGGVPVALATAAAALLSLAPGLAMTLPFSLPRGAEEERSPAEEEWKRQVALFPRCMTERAMERIASLPPGRVASTSNLGAGLLLRSPHEVVSAPYHRNQAGMLGQLRVALAETPQEAERSLKDMGVDYLVLCRSDYELHFVRNGADGPKPLLLRLVQGDVALPGYPLILRRSAILVFGSPPGSR